MPRALVTKLTALSILREPKGGCCTRGPQFSYRIIDMGGSAWHVLSCVQSAGADYSGRACHTAHHLVLSQQEVTGLMKDALRPTPAGITLALQRSGFWVQKWQGEPRYIVGEPPVQPDFLPDASVQPTWKHLTGHKSNARAFYTPPYDRECLVTLPADTPSGEVLGLFHESDWLTHTLGWGVTYTTEADETDSFADTLRMVTAAHSPLVQRAVRTGHPVLHITPDMELSMEPAAPPASDAEPIAPRKNDFRVLSRSVSHYHYTEEPDWVQYDVPMPGSNPYVLPLVTAGSALLLAGVTVGIWLGVSRPMELLDELTTTEPYIGETTEVQVTGVQKMENLLRAPYDHAATVKVLSELRSLQETSPEDSLLIECAGMISNAQQDGANHPAVLRRIAECARLLGLKEEEMGKLYLMEATRGHTLDSWHHLPSTQNAIDWTALSQDAPILYSIFDTDPELQPYEPGSYETHPTPTTELATADKPTPPAGDKMEEKPLRVIGTQPAVRGQSTPEALSRVLAEAPLVIKSGYYSVVELKKGEKLSTAQRLALSPEGYTLTISPTGKKGEYMLRPVHQNGQQGELPAVTFRLAKNKVQEIECNGNEAIVSFPVPEDEHTLTNIILAPKIAIPLPGEKPISLPAAEKLDNLGMTVDNLVVTEPENKGETCTLKIKNRGRKFPWKLSKEHIARIEFEVYLPVLAKENSIVREQNEESRLSWKEAKVVKEDKKSTQLHCVVEHRPHFPESIEREFDRVANSPCCGMPDVENKHMTLAQLFYIANALKETRNDKTRNFLFQAYEKMLNHAQFGSILRSMLKEELTLPTRKGRKEYDERADLKEALIRDKGYEDILKSTCTVLRNAMIRNAYISEKEAFEAESRKKHSLILHGLTQGSGGVLQWHFHLETEK